MLRKQLSIVVFMGICADLYAVDCGILAYENATTVSGTLEGSIGRHIATLDGGTVVVGSFSGAVDLDPGVGVDERLSSGGTDLYVLKLDVDGAYIWGITIGGVFSDYANSAAEGPDGSIIVGGRFSGLVDFDPSDGQFVLEVEDGWDAFAWRLGPDGAFEWAGQMGGDSWDEVWDVAVSADGSIFVLGTFSGPADLDPGEGVFEDESTGIQNTFITALNSFNQFEWARAYNNDDYLMSFGVAVAGHDMLVIGGYFYGTMDFDSDGLGDVRTASPAGDAFLTSASLDGEYLWTRNFGGLNSDVSLDVIANGSGDIVAAGFFSNQVDFDPTEGLDVKGSHGKKDVFVTKYDVDGNYDWTWTTGGTGYEEGNTVALDADGGIYLTGLFSGSNDEPGYEVDFDPSEEGVDIHVTGGDDEMFLTHLRSDGTYQWTLSTFGETGVYGSSIAVGADGEVSVGGEFYDTADLDPTDGEALFSSAGANDVFLITLNCADEALPCAGDVNYDSIVDPLDSGYVLSRFNCPVSQGDPLCDAADANFDGLVDPLDVGYVMSRFGPCL